MNVATPIIAILASISVQCEALSPSRGPGILGILWMPDMKSSVPWFRSVMRFTGLTCYASFEVLKNNYTKMISVMCKRRNMEFYTLDSDALHRNDYIIRIFVNPRNGNHFVYQKGALVGANDGHHDSDHTVDGHLLPPRQTDALKFFQSKELLFLFRPVTSSSAI